MGEFEVLAGAVDSTVQVRLRGDWTADATRPQRGELFSQLERDAQLRSIGAIDAGITAWDSTLVACLFRLSKLCAARGGELETHQFPPGALALLRLASAVPERAGAQRTSVRDGFFTHVGRSSSEFVHAFLDALAFLGEATVALFRLVSGRARVPFRDVVVTIQQCGPGALPIVTLISGLVGLILAFIGAQQLARFGAEIYVANLVSIAMAREMAAIMVGVIMAGRTGAAFAAQLGTMQVNEEVDALSTFGFSPMEFLVLPRMLALIVMLPLLCIYADLIGILGGALVSASVLGISPLEFFSQVESSLMLRDVWVGIVKSVVFGILVALAGCMRGLQCGRSASAVGNAVTSAVVFGIVAIVVADAIFAIVCQVIGI